MLNVNGNSVKTNIDDKFLIYDIEYRHFSYSVTLLQGKPTIDVPIVT